ncbi:MAG TPA: DUF4026 domain-containing protein, partial [Phycisphaerales bacterium]|nr:DUF4026 domain-containing protein [Phycisphaerales bacterium]
MLSIFAKETPSAGSVLYRGNLPPRPEEFSFLEKQGTELKRLKVGDFAHWGLTARHPQWGEAQLVCLRETKIPSEVVMFAPGLTDEERRAAAGTSVSVSVRVPAKHKTVLKDRKRMLRWGRELMADDGLVLMDHQSMQGWGKDRLDDELMHDADLDVEALYAVHGVTEDDPKKEDEPACLWMHTHGLGELGAFDFDIIRPHAELNTVRGADLLRSMAFAILEGKLAADVA